MKVPFGKNCLEMRSISAICHASRLSCTVVLGSLVDGLTKTIPEESLYYSSSVSKTHVYKHVFTF